MGAFASRLDRFSVRTKLAMLFALVSILPVCAVGILSLDVSSRSMLEKGVQDSLSRLEFVSYRVDEIMREKHAEALSAAFNRYVRAYYDPGCVSLSDAPSVIEDQARREIIRLYNSQEDTSVLLIGPGEALMYSTDASAVQPLAMPEATVPGVDEFYLFDRWADAAWDKGEAVIPYERLVLGNDDSRPVALIRVNVRESLFGALYRAYEPARGSAFFIANDRGNVISCTDKALFGATVQDALGDTTDANESGFVRMDGNVLVHYRDSARALTYYERIPVAWLNAGFTPILLTTVGVALLCVVFCALLGSAIARSFTKPLYRLIDRISSFEGGAGLGKGSAVKNEIAILSDKYGQILGRLEAAIEAYSEEQRKKKEAQIRALEFQINPHFLYNTLSTIIWLIEAGEDKKAIRIIKELSQFFRISISKGREYITLGEELKHVELYIDIQMARYEGGIAVAYDVPEALLGCLTPKLILQPLVENSIKHAMDASAQRKCRVRVSARAEGDDILLEVVDDGALATDQTISEMNRFLYYRTQSAAGKDYGIGISNVHDRVAMCFGEGYGLRYARVNGETVASVRIKRMTGGEAMS